MTESRHQTFSAGQNTNVPRNTNTFSAPIRLASNGRISVTASSSPPPPKMTPREKMTG
jgi:hypothetical protein